LHSCASSYDPFDSISLMARAREVAVLDRILIAALRVETPEQQGLARLERAARAVLPAINRDLAQLAAARVATRPSGPLNHLQ
jgi:hypothetical protein